MKSNFEVLHLLHFYFIFFSEEKSQLSGSNSRPNVSEGYEVPTELPGSTGLQYSIVVCALILVIVNEPVSTEISSKLHHFVVSCKEPALVDRLSIFFVEYCTVLAVA